MTTAGTTYPLVTIGGYSSLHQQQHHQRRVSKFSVKPNSNRPDRLIQNPFSTVPRKTTRDDRLLIRPERIRALLIGVKLTRMLDLLERSRYTLVIMNTLKPERKAAVIRALVEGNSIRSTVRMTGVAKNTIVRLLVEVGEACSAYQDATIKNVTAKYVECDEIWSFVGCKAKNCTPEKAAEGQGDVWTWTAIDAESKLVISWYVGDRGGWSARIFIKDVAARLANRVQLTSDGHKAYLMAVERSFGADIDYAQLVKLYGNDLSEEKRYSPAVCTAAVKNPVTGNPDEKHISTSFVERNNLTTRMSIRRFTRLTNAFSKKLENHVAAISLHFMYYNFARPHTTLTKNHPTRYPTTPAMAAGIADHVWTVEEIIGLTSN